MRTKISFCLSVIGIVALLASGCKAVDAREINQDSLPAVNKTVSGCDQEAYSKIAKLVDHSSQLSEAVKLEYAALVKSVSAKKGAVTLSLDKIEPIKNYDPQGEFYNNPDELIESVTLADNIIILADPHNNYEAVTAQGLKNLLEDTDIPFLFYSMGGEISIIIEMMLP